MEEKNKVLDDALTRAIANQIKGMILNLILGIPYYICMWFIIFEIMSKK